MSIEKSYPNVSVSSSIRAQQGSPSGEQLRDKLVRAYSPADGYACERIGFIRVKENHGGPATVDLVFPRRGPQAKRPELVFSLSAQQLGRLHRAPAGFPFDYQYEGLLVADGAAN